MKLIIAVIQSENLQAVETALYAQEVNLLSINQVLGDGREPGHSEIYRGRTVRMRPTKIRLEIAAHDLFVEYAVEAIVRACSTGDSEQVGHSHIVVLHMDEYVPIRKGKRVRAAVGAKLEATCGTR